MLPAAKAVEEALHIRTLRSSVVLRLILVAATTAVGLVLPSFELLQALTGSLNVCGLCMPPFAYWRLRGREMGVPHLAWCWFVMLFGLLCTAFITVPVSRTIYTRLSSSPVRWGSWGLGGPARACALLALVSVLGRVGGRRCPRLRRRAARWSMQVKPGANEVVV